MDRDRDRLTELFRFPLGDRERDPAGDGDRERLPAERAGDDCFLSPPFDDSTSGLDAWLASLLLDLDLLLGDGDLLVRLGDAEDCRCA